MNYMKLPENLVHAAFFFTDIVGLSNPTMSVDTQTTKIRVLNKIIKDCKTFKNESQKLILPTGDGMAIGFVSGLTQPLELAIEFQEKLEQYNKNKSEFDKVRVRIGCHVGNVFLVEDILGNMTFWGPGIILAHRVMDIGDAWHILMTASMAESLIELSEEYKKILHPLHDYEIKHEQKILVYSAHGENFGNAKLPSKGLIEKSLIKEYSEEMNNKFFFKEITFELRLDDLDKQTIHHERYHRLINNSEEPIYEILTGIATSVEKTFRELNIEVVDEIGQELKIVSINVDTPNRKEFTIKLNRPIFINEVDRGFIIKHTSEAPERYFENVFLFNAKNFSMEFSFPTNSKIKTPKLYLKHNEQKTTLDPSPDIKRGLYTQILWTIENGISKNDSIRLEW